MAIRRPEVRFGSISTKLDYPGDVCFPPDTDRTADIADSPVRAISGLLGNAVLSFSEQVATIEDLKHAF
jgi:hypothetical protein